MINSFLNLKRCQQQPSFLLCVIASNYCCVLRSFVELAVCDPAAHRGRCVERNRQEVKVIGAFWKCDGVSSTPALVVSYHAARLALLIEPAHSLARSGWNRLRSCFYYILHPLPVPLSNSLVQAPAGYLFVRGFSHLS